MWVADVINPNCFVEIEIDLKLIKNLNKIGMTQYNQDLMLFGGESTTTMSDSNQTFMIRNNKV